MKTTLLAFSFIGLLFFGAGCITKTPIVTKDASGNLMTNELYAVSSGTTAVLNGVTSVASVIPTPYSWMVSTAATGITTLLGAFVAYRNRNWQGVATSIIQGVEAADPTAASPVKKSVAATASANGNADKVEKAVNDITGSQ